MTRIFYAIRNRLFPRPTVATALAGFTKAIDTLAAVIEDTQQDIDAVNVEIDRLHARNDNLRQTRDRATGLHAKLSEIVA